MKALQIADFRLFRHALERDVRRKGITRQGFRGSNDLTRNERGGDPLSLRDIRNREGHLAKLGLVVVTPLTCHDQRRFLAGFRQADQLGDESCAGVNSGAEAEPQSKSGATSRPIAKPMTRIPQQLRNVFQSSLEPFHRGVVSAFLGGKNPGGPRGTRQWVAHVHGQLQIQMSHAGLKRLQIDCIKLEQITTGTRSIQSTASARQDRAKSLQGAKATIDGGTATQPDDQRGDPLIEHGVNQLPQGMG